MTTSLTNKIALVTGASRTAGIGAAIARELAVGGIDLFITYYRPYDSTVGVAAEPSEAESLLTELRQMGVRAEGLELDLSEVDAPRHLFDEVEARFGPVDILVNNATHSEHDGIDRLDADLLDRHYRLNVRGMALLCAEFARRFKGESGRIINLSSGQGVGPMPEELAYAATKGAVEAFTVSLSAEVGRRGITVNAVDPGATDTGWMTPELKTHLAAETVLGRVAVPEDAARLIRFLASDEAGYITGQVIHSRGGL